MISTKDDKLAKDNKIRQTRSNLSCNEIVSVIKCGKDNGVRSLRFKDLYVQYHASVGVSLETDLVAGPHPSKVPEEELEEVLPQQEFDQKEIELAIMAIEDPDAYEQLLASGELTEKEDATES